MTEGPFASFLAEVETLTLDDRVKALVNTFGRMTPVEFDLDHLEDLSKKGKRKAA